MKAKNLVMHPRLQSLLKSMGCLLVSVLWLVVCAGVAISPLSWLEGTLLLVVAATALARPMLGAGWWHGRRMPASRRR